MHKVLPDDFSVARAGKAPTFASIFISLAQVFILHFHQIVVEIVVRHYLFGLFVAPRMTGNVSKTSNLELASIDQGDPIELGAIGPHVQWVESRLVLSVALVRLVLFILP